MEKVGLKRRTAEERAQVAIAAPVVENGTLVVGSARRKISDPRSEDIPHIPSILYYDNPQQTRVMESMLRAFNHGKHLLLIGNQGVGKNKLADRLLQLLRLPREYIQLHRDVTIQSLTSNPTVRGNVLVYEDSPLVIAAKHGRVLVVDEADKAPTHVTAVLKCLVEDEAMLLGDGRRLTKDNIHPDFRVIALANRPGFPFHGNDFFREVGDVFSCHVVDNPDFASECACSNSTRRVACQNEPSAD